MRSSATPPITRLDAVALAAPCDQGFVVHPLGDGPATVPGEIVGVWFALMFVPKWLPWVTAAFVLFRVAGIAKPWPVSRIDTRVAGGQGIMTAAVSLAAWYVVA